MSPPGRPWLQVAWNAYVQKKYPISLVHFITNRCNARCLHCFIDFEDPKTFQGDLTLDEIRTLTKHVGPSLFNVNLTGGEPFLRKDIWEIAEAYFQNTPIQSVFITTHGQFTEKIQAFLERFIASKFSASRKIIFSFSIDNLERKHDQNRKVEGLFNQAIKSVRLVEEYQHPRIMGNVAITVTDHNYMDVLEVYDYLKQELKISAFTATAMREEGVVKRINPDMKKQIHTAYVELTRRIHEDQLHHRTRGFKRDLQGSLMNAKNRIINEAIAETYVDKHYISRCPAAAMFGVIGNDGQVYPCEILDRPLGNLRDYGMNFLALWENALCHDARRFIKDTHCNCTYECAWTVNVITNPQYLPRLASDVIRQHL